MNYTDTEILNWIEDLFSISSESSPAWREFYSNVSAMGFRKAAQREMEAQKVRPQAEKREGGL